jgi:hypothetical protein
MTKSSAARAHHDSAETWFAGMQALRREVGEPIGWAGYHGATGHCLSGKHHACAYRPGGACYPEITFDNGDTYACPCRCHDDHDHG